MTSPVREPESVVARFAGNVASLLTSDVLNKATTFAIYAMVSRYVGMHSFGQLSLGLLLLYTFQVFATIGLPTLLRGKWPGAGTTRADSSPTAAWR